MSRTTDRELHALTPGQVRLGHIAAHPRAIAIGCVLMLTALGWAYLGIVQANVGLWAALCSTAQGGGLSEWTLAFAMWAAMVLAMMVPSAAPMVLSYAEIADTAARKNERIVSPFVLTGGYVVVWLGFALIAAALQSALMPHGATLPPMVSGQLFVVAGLYQFSPLKQACLRQCQNPFPFFFNNWATTPRGVFRLGVKQGLYCLGCCWAAMALMFAFGAMNIIWMAGFGVIMTIEKLMRGLLFTRIVGVAFVVIGVWFFTGVGF